MRETLLGTVVALVLQTTKNSIRVAAGMVSTQQMGATFWQEEADLVLRQYGMYLFRTRGAELRASFQTCSMGWKLRW